MVIDQKKAISIINRKRAAVFVVKYSYKHKVTTARLVRFNGYANLMSLRVKENQRLHINYRVLEGECVLGYVQDKVFHKLADDKFEQAIELNNRKGLIRLRVIGDKASINLELKVMKEDM